MADKTKKSAVREVEDVEVLGPEEDFEAEALDGEVLPPEAEADLSASAEPSTPGEALSVPSLGGDSYRHFLAMAKAYAPFEEAEERALGRRARAGDEAASKDLVVHNLRLVVTIAYSYRRSLNNIVDLLQEGAIGLVEATSRWDPDVGPRFGTYAAYWIRAHILRFLMTNSRLVHTGNTRAGRKLFFRLEKERQKLLAQGLVPSVALIADRLEMKPEAVEEVARHLDSREMSTDTRFEPGAPTLGERLVGAELPPEDALMDAERTQALQNLVANFEKTLKSDRDRSIWTENLVAPDPLPLSVLADRYGVSRQRMTQLAQRLKKAFKKQVLENLGDGDLPDWLR